MSERIYQVIIGVLVLVVLVGGGIMIAARRSTTPSTVSSDDNAASSTMGDNTNGNQTVTAGEEKTTDTAGQKNSAGTTSSKGAKTTTSGKTASGSSSTGGNSGMVSITDQSAGKTVTVNSVSVSKPTWVTVEDKTQWYLGAQLIQPGSHNNLTINLLRATKPGETYQLVLFTDNGNGVFDVHGDTPVTKADGSRATTSFLTK